MKGKIKRVAIVGVGLIGGSIGMAIKRRKLAGEVIGIGRRKESLEKALRFGAVDRSTLDIGQGVKEANLIVVATPVSVIVEMVRRMMPSLHEGQILTDVGSTKKRIVEDVERIISNGVSFVGGHPMAGSEKKGVESAKSELFDGSTCVLTPGSSTSKEALEMVTFLWKGMGAEVVVMEPKEHDFLVAAVSHLPHLIATTLVNIVDNLRKKGEGVLPLVASGFRDSTRIASSPPEMWKDIYLANKEDILRVLQKFRTFLGRMEKFISNEDVENLLAELKRAKISRDEMKKE